MDKNKGKLPSSKLSAFFESADDEPSFPHKAVDNAKLSQYTSGTLRKSRREKEQEAAEAKKREEEINAAKAYAEFLDAFEGDDVGRKSASTFVKSSVESASTYIPSMPRSDRVARALKSPSPPTSTVPRAKGKRAMDAFLEEIKKDQAEREAKFSRHGGRSVTAMAAYEGQSGSKDRGDPQTTNIFVANLPANITEQSLGNFFARVGPVGSVKVMWPRPDAGIGPGADMTASRRSKSAGLSGFVSYMTRQDAEEALREFDGFDWGGSVLRVGWSKAVPIAAKPMFVSNTSKPRFSRSRSRSRDQSRSPSHHRRSRSESYSRSRSPKRRRERSRSRDHHRRDSRRHRSSSREEEVVTDTFIRAVAAEVKGHDSHYEEHLRKREENNPKYAFLRRHNRGYSYYKDLIHDDRPASPEFDDDGYNSVYSTDSAEESERERSRKNKLGRLARKRFEAMIRALSGKRGEIARCMAFSLEHAEAAHEVADIIVASLLVDGTPVPRKVARLHLICDILHNSAASVPSAWKFRQEFQARLGIVFDHMANIYHSFPGRITAETFKKQITSIVDIWEDWIVFPPDFTSELRARLEGIPVEGDTTLPTAQRAEDDLSSAYTSRFKASSFQEAAPETNEAPIKANVLDNMEDDLDGAPIADDGVDGMPLEDVDGMPLDDVDGMPLEEDVDGVPMEEDDVDGVPMDDS
ncbi:hypothetical protein VKT23_000790 [Stygiomarasmius scandens]|uniref:U2 snRNP-associated SURP motif-containing protein n=1 Tax=Marasmiellus scandens TaxID=2682957 RepID=A0ABR1K653_9AGAR